MPWAASSQFFKLMMLLTIHCFESSQWRMIPSLFFEKKSNPWLLSYCAGNIVLRWEAVAEVGTSCLTQVKLLVKLLLPQLISDILIKEYNFNAGGKLPGPGWLTEMRDAKSFQDNSKRTFSIEIRGHTSDFHGELKGSLGWPILALKQKRLWCEYESWSFSVKTKQNKKNHHNKTLVKIILCLNSCVLAQELTPAQKHSGCNVDEHSWKDSVVANTVQQSKSSLNAAKDPFFDQLQSL